MNQRLTPGLFIMTIALNLLQSECAAIIDNDDNKAFITKKLSDSNSSRQLLKAYVEKHQALPWYQRAWQRLTQSYGRVETYYYATCIAETVSHDPANFFSINKILTEAKSQLSFFSGLYFSIARALQTLPEQKRPSPEPSTKQQQNSYEQESSAPSESIKPKSAPNPFRQPRLYLTPSLLMACDHLRIDTAQPITWTIVQKAYKARILETHPDKNTGGDATAFIEVMDSYDLLKDYKAKLIAQEHYSGTNPGEDNEDLDEETAKLYARCREALDQIAADMAKNEIQRVADRAKQKAYWAERAIQRTEDRIEVEVKQNAYWTQVETQRTEDRIEIEVKQNAYWTQVEAQRTEDLAKRELYTSKQDAKIADIEAKISSLIQNKEKKESSKIDGLESKYFISDSDEEKKQGVSNNKTRSAPSFFQKFPDICIPSKFDSHTIEETASCK